RMTIVDAHAQSVMCAYNRFRGMPCCGSSELLQQILRNEWNFRGYVVSDCWGIMDFYTFHKVVPNAVEAAAMAARAGTDLNCGVTYDSLAVAVRKGLVNESVIDESIKRLFRTRFQLGMFDPPERVAYALISSSVNDSKKHSALADETANKSIVLLKNEGVLPLSKNLKTIAVIGPNADDVETLLGNYNGTPSNPITPLAGIQQKVSSTTKVLYARGSSVAQNIPALVPIPTSALFTETHANGLKSEYYSNQSFHGKPFATRIDANIDFNWWERSPIDGMRADSFSVRWTGTIVPPVSGRYALGARAMGTLQLTFEDSLLVEFTDRHNLQTESKSIELKSGVAYRIQCEFTDQRPDAIVQLVWDQPNVLLKEEAIAAARQADAVILMMGLSPRIEGEEMPVSIPGFKSGDRVDIGLPQPQETLMKEIVALGKPVVLVLLNGSALAINWAAENVPAIVEAWYPGQAAGTAIADVLFGDYNPSGRLPVTFYKSVDQLPPFSEYSMKDRTYRYFTGEPLFPFGYGLSYTSFAYSDLKISAKVRSGERVEISVDVENTGSIEGNEVVQLYVTDVQATVPIPIRSLQGIRVVHLKPGEKKNVRFTLTPRQLSLIDQQNKRALETGMFEISVGGKQPGMKGRADTKTTGVVTGRFEVVGEKMIIGELED
ncbi:MAG TPA: glycoside hydrolase family 3 C-terminal domain-containing protein, partial [Bacteroidota bacterium]